VEKPSLSSSPKDFPPGPSPVGRRTIPPEHSHPLIIRPGPSPRSPRVEGDFFGEAPQANDGTMDPHPKPKGPLTPTKSLHHPFTARQASSPHPNAILTVSPRKFPRRVRLHDHPPQKGPRRRPMKSPSSRGPWECEESCGAVRFSRRHPGQHAQSKVGLPRPASGEFHTRLASRKASPDLRRKSRPGPARASPQAGAGTGIGGRLAVRTEGRGTDGDRVGTPTASQAEFMEASFAVRRKASPDLRPWYLGGNHWSICADCT
jgi:hypothetical protein